MLCSLSCHSQTRLSSNAALGLRLTPAETRARCGYDEDTTQLRSCSVNTFRSGYGRGMNSLRLIMGNEGALYLFGLLFLLNFVVALSRAYPSAVQKEKDVTKQYAYYCATPVICITLTLYRTVVPDYVVQDLLKVSSPPRVIEHMKAALSPSSFILHPSARQSCNCQVLHNEVALPK
jgi:hypothetical protein